MYFVIINEKPAFGLKLSALKSCPVGWEFSGWYGNLTRQLSLITKQDY